MNALFEEAISLRDQGDYKGACKMFSVFIEKWPDDFGGYLLKGGILLFQLHLTDQALDCLQKAVQLNPKSELSSVALFHCLWKKGESDLAFEEAKRYVKTAGRSEEYDFILKEINESIDNNTLEDIE
ncbi:MAG: tetratricopeptide repeat protein [Sedimentisphaerales bacterium]|nr:tetratricopeptide repeat protein [Sedimentisphaerales bacterium]